MIETISGMITGLIGIALVTLFPKQVPARFLAAAMLCAIASIYVGFALQEDTVYAIVTEVTAAIFFYVIAVAGYREYTSLLGSGIILHGAWDIFHHHGAIIETNIPAYWPVYCLVADLVLGIFFLVYLKKTESRKQSFQYV